MKVVAAVLDQVLIAKDSTRAEHGSNDLQAFEDRRERGVKRRPGQRFEIEIRHAPRVLLAPLIDWITWRGHVESLSANHKVRQSGALRTARVTFAQFRSLAISAGGLR